MTGYAARSHEMPRRRGETYSYLAGFGRALGPEEVAGVRSWAASRGLSARIDSCQSPLGLKASVLLEAATAEDQEVFRALFRPMLETAVPSW